MMTRNKRIIPNRDGKPQVFGVDEYDNHIVLGAYMTNDVAAVDIPSAIDGKAITAIGDGCFFAHEEITAVSFPESLKEIGVQAFGMCKGISELILPDSVTEIESLAFRDCTGLRRIVLPANLKTLKTGVFAFTYLPDDVDITFNEGLETIQPKVFSSGGLNLFFTLRIPSSVKECAADAFEPGITVVPAN